MEVPGDVENEAHEEACAYREYICPISDECEWTGFQTELLDHCRLHHRDKLVLNPCTLSMDITRSSLDNYLMCSLAVLFVIQTKVCTATQKMYHSVRQIGDPARAANHEYTLCIQKGNGRFCTDRHVVPHSSIETDIHRLLAMLEDLTGTTFTITVTRRNITPVFSFEATIVCEQCESRSGWLFCLCPYTELADTCDTFKLFKCFFRSQCAICSADITRETLDEHYTQAHADITHRAGTVCVVRPGNAEREFCVMGHEVGWVAVTYLVTDTEFYLIVYTPLPKGDVYKYRCAVNISHPHTGRTRTCETGLGYVASWDWRVEMSRANLNKYLHNNKVNINISVMKNVDQS